MDYGKYPDYASYPANTQWYDSYEILRAETDLTPTTDLITQEELSSPSIEQILTNQNDGNATSMVRDWRMTYVSLELKDITDPNRRLKDVYDESVMYTEVKNEDGTVSKVLTTPPGAHGTGLEDGEVDIDGSKNDYQYLLLITFRLKQYGAAIECYEKILDSWRIKSLSDEFTAKIWHNIGASYAGIFWFGKALAAYDMAYNFEKKPETLKIRYEEPADVKILDGFSRMGETALRE